jgi:hypothetical protein
MDSIHPQVGEAVPMPTSNEYRKKAEECYRLANEAKTETDRLACLDLARSFLDAAARQEEMTYEQTAEAQKPERAPKLETETSQSNTGWGWRQLLGLFREHRHDAQDT